MKMMDPSVYAEYSRILRTLRARGERLDFFMMGAAADLAVEMAESEPDEDRIRELQTRLGLDPKDLT